MVSGVCQVCGCTDDAACAEGCAWTNAEHTLCSECSECGRAAVAVIEHSTKDFAVRKCGRHAVAFVEAAKRSLSAIDFARLSLRLIDSAEGPDA